MALNQIEVRSPANIADGTLADALGGRQADAIVSALHGKYYTQNARGNVYYASNAGAGAAFSIFSNTTYVGLALWNPLGSGKNLSLIRCSIGITGQASTAASGWGYAWANRAGASTAAAAPITAFTAITATRGSCICGLGGQGNSVARTGSGATLTALLWGRAATFGTSTGAITTEMGEGPLVEDFDGMMIVPPDCFFAVTSSILSGITACATLFWEEVPTP